MAENAVNTEQGVILEALNNKVDLNQLNTNNQGLSYVSGLGMPSDRYINLTLGASGTTYTAPANGYFWLNKTSGSTNKYISLSSPNMGVTTVSYNSTLWTNIYIPARKGDVVKVSYDFTGTTNSFRYVYAQGESEE